jgi:nucleotide-binding universal stress UspA family protein
MFQRILLTTDFSAPSLHLFDFTVGLAKALGSEVYLLHVDEEESMYSLRSSDALIRFFRDIELKRDEWMDRLSDDVTAQGIPCTQLRAKGAASEEILGAVERHAIDLIAMATVGAGGMKRILIGSTTKKVLRNAPCALLTANADFGGREAAGAPLPPARVRRIVYPFDFSESARAHLDSAVRMAERLDAQVELLKVLKIPTLIPSLPGEPPITLPESSLEYLEQDSQVELQEVVRSLGSARFTHAVAIGSDEAETIADYAAENAADLIVIPRAGESALRRFFFGRVAHGVVKLSRVPVLSLPVPSV